MFKIDMEEAIKPEAEIKDVTNQEELPPKDKIEESSDAGTAVDSENEEPDNREDAEDSKILQSTDAASDNSEKKYWAKLKKERKARREIAAKLEAVEQEKLAAEKLLHESFNANVNQYQQSLQSNLTVAEAKLQEALKSGNEADVSSAVTEISMIAQSLNNSENTTPNNAAYNEEDIMHRQAQEHQQRLYSWLADNPELDKSNPEYDDSLTKEVMKFIPKVENSMKANNKAHLIGSYHYYNIIDEFVDNIRSNKNNPKYFGSVHSRVPNSTAKETKKRELTRQEKQAALAFGQTEKQYLDYLNKYNQEQIDN